MYKENGRHLPGFSFWRAKWFILKNYFLPPMLKAENKAFSCFSQFVQKENPAINVNIRLAQAQELGLTILTRYAFSLGTLLYIISLAVGTFTLDKIFFGFLLIFGYSLSNFRFVAYYARAYSLVYLVFFLGLVEIYFFGINPFSLIFLYLSGTFAALFGKKRLVVFLMLLSTGLILGVSYFQFSKLFIPIQVPIFPFHSLGNLVEFSILFVISLGSVQIAIVYILHSLGCAFAEQKEAQILLERERSNLETRVAERTALLRKKEASLASAQKRAKLGSWERDLLTGHEEWAEVMLSLFGLNEKEASYQKFLSMVYDDDRSLVDDMENYAIESGESVSYIFRVGSTDNDFRHFYAIVDPEVNVQGKTVSLAGTIQEITSQQKSENELRKLFQAVEQSPATVVITDLSGKIEYVNPRFSELTGYSAQEAMGRNPRVLKSGKMPEDFYKQMWGTITSGQIWKGEFYNKKKNGELFWESASISPLRNSDGEVTHFIAVKEDITERKTMEAHLIEARSQAEAANRAKSQFLANMSHEIRTPMNAIIGFSQLLLNDSSINSKHRSDIEVINRSGEHLLNLINDILDMSKIESGKMVINLEDFSLSAMLDYVEKLFLIPCQNKKINLRVEKDLPDNFSDLIISDELKLRQVIINLMSNAIKFTKQGGITLRIILKPNESEEGFFHLTVEVADTGIGIAQENLDRIFLPFEQIAHAKSNPESSVIEKEKISVQGHRGQQGSGLGLVISKNFVQMLGGELTVQSELNVGSVFRFTIPIKASEKKRSSVQKEQGEVVGLAPESNHPLVLVVDDNQVNRSLLRAILTKVGFQIAEAVNGLEAVAFVREHHPAVVLMDLRMPEMDGYEASMQIRALQPDLPIIAVTASAFDDRIQQIREAGMNGYIRKPFRSGEIFSSLEQLVPLQFIYTSQKRNTSVVPAFSEKLSFTDIKIVNPDITYQELGKGLVNAVEQGDMNLFNELLEKNCEATNEIVQKFRSLAEHYEYDLLISEITKTL